MSERRSLILLSPGFPSSEADTTCLPMQQRFVRSLQKLRPDLRIVVLAFQYPYIEKKYSWHGIEVVSFDGRNRGGLKRLIVRHKIARTASAIHNETPITGMLSCWYGECAYVGEKLSKRYGWKHYCWLLGQDAKAGNTYPSKARIPGSRLIALSDSLQEEFCRNYKVEPSHVIPPGIEPAENVSMIGRRTIDVLGAGSLIPLKRFELLIEIVADLIMSIPGIQCMIVGDGPEKLKLQNLIDERQLHENIKLTGEVSHGDLQSLMKKSKILIHPSAYEGFSGVCQEALAAGCHVISFCKPMKRDFSQWHIVQDKQSMSAKAMVLLQDGNLSFQMQAPYMANSTAGAMLNLFGL